MASSRRLLLVVLACGFASCVPAQAPDAGGEDPLPTRRDAGPRDAGVAADGGPPSADAGDEAGPAADAGGADEDAGEAGLLDGGPNDGGAALTCVSPASVTAMQTSTWSDASGSASVTVDDVSACHRTYSLATTATLRDGLPENPRVVVEMPGAPTLRTGHQLFDALYALALEETRELSVQSIQDGSFNDGAPVPCGGCFETGRLWRYVWTRDTAYAADLGLALVDPARTRASLELKLSERRGGGDLQVVQDTGTGGSYPVSSDRVAWALGAAALLDTLTGAAREEFRARAYLALRNTLEHDRVVVFDAEDGLYRGEQSFLDWREQSYPEWTAGDVVHIAMSKALSTNLLHLFALELTARLAQEAADASLAARYSGWADALRQAVRERFWLEDEGLFSTFVTTTLDLAPARRFDLLGSALAVLLGVADEAQAARVLAGYPHYGNAAPVLFPQQQLTAIYHNRAEWPFVSAYWLRAAKRAENDVVVDRMVRALVRGAALNLSNMESFEAQSGLSYLEDGVYSGPVVSSQRQLWSVAGYLSMVQHTLFGLEPTPAGLAVRPFVTRGLHRALFAGTSELALNDVVWHGRRVTVVLHLPEEALAGTGHLVVESIRLNGALLEGDLLEDALLGEQNRVDVTLVNGGASSVSLTEANPADWREIYGPRTPRVTDVSEAGGQLSLALSTNGEATADVTFTLYRDGAVIAAGLAGTTASFTDPGSDASADETPCYVAELAFVASGTRSQRSPPVCFWGASGERVTSVPASALTNVGGAPSNDHGRFHYEPWGDEGDSLTLASFTPTASGRHLLQVVYGNGAGPVSTGVTCALKRLLVTDTATDVVVADGALVMPHLGSWGLWADSSFVPAELEAGKSYRVVIASDDAMVNMSSFAHFESYTGGLGGAAGAFNRVNIAELKILRR